MWLAAFFFFAKRTFGYGRRVLKATIVIILSIILGVGATMAIRNKSKSLAVRGAIAGLAIVTLVIVLKPEK